MAQTLQNPGKDNGFDSSGLHRRLKMTAGSIYIPLGTMEMEKEPAPAGFFMMDHLLYSRMDCGYPSNDERYDEDVNVYLAGLLESLIFPIMHGEARKQVTPYDLDLFESIAGANDPRAAFNLYRLNADSILLSLGIFDNPRASRPDSIPHLGLSRDAWLGRGKAYYSIAQSYRVQADRRSTAMSDIMGKLSEGFEKYLKVLSTMKSEYMNILGRISEGEMYHLDRAVRGEEIRKELGALHDEFLDAYSEYMRNPSDAAREAVGEKAARIRSLDPDFSFELG